VDCVEAEEEFETEEEKAELLQGKEEKDERVELRT